MFVNFNASCRSAQPAMMKWQTNAQSRKIFVTNVVVVAASSCMSFCPQSSPRSRPRPHTSCYACAAFAGGDWQGVHLKKEKDNFTYQGFDELYIPLCRSMMKHQ